MNGTKIETVVKYLKNLYSTMQDSLEFHFSMIKDGITLKVDINHFVRIDITLSSFLISGDEWNFLMQVNKVLEVLDAFTELLSKQRP